MVTQLDDICFDIWISVSVLIQNPGKGRGPGIKRKKSGLLTTQTDGQTDQGRC